MEVLSENRSFGGVQTVYRHPSNTCGCEMTFAVYMPPQTEDGHVPVLWYLSGLTCTHENAMTKGGFQQHAARYGLAVVFPDTSPRGDSVADDEAYDLGQGASFYVNATRDPWRGHFRMYDYITSELRSLVTENLPVADAHGITGHSMGGHGALTIALRNAEMYDSVSAFAPIANPTQSDWGRKQLSSYLGDDESAWSNHDSTILLEEHGWKGDILIDQGASDQFLDLLRPEALVDAMAKRRQPGQVRMQRGYDHSYYFVNTFAADHVEWHAQRLNSTRH
ncbi:S-formylglutathione hydrolase [Thalassococcus sp. BH17M4-6]|uniref:S-formylglutathione hydrolase n=1 Tax=Thalassococcus sp. BH17M4-6 TaxID=3413148 RepID=UPI003BBEAA82